MTGGVEGWGNTQPSRVSDNRDRRKV